MFVGFNSRLRRIIGRYDRTNIVYCTSSIWSSRAPAGIITYLHTSQFPSQLLPFGVGTYKERAHAPSFLFFYSLLHRQDKSQGKDMTPFLQLYFYRIPMLCVLKDNTLYALVSGASDNKGKKRAIWSCKNASKLKVNSAVIMLSSTMWRIIK